jgi:hypothetical protein
MEEVLRVPDQAAMSDGEFRDFLASRGVPAGVPDIPRAETEIALMTGPHLGAFNRGIDLPELIDFLCAASALCVAGRYRMEKGRP